MDLIIVILLVTVGLGLIRWILLSFMLKTPAPLYIFLIVNILATIITINSAGLAGTWLLLVYLGVAIWYVCIPVETNTESKLTI